MKMTTFLGLSLLTVLVVAGAAPRGHAMKIGNVGLGRWRAPQVTRSGGASQVQASSGHGSSQATADQLAAANAALDSMYQVRRALLQELTTLRKGLRHAQGADEKAMLRERIERLYQALARLHERIRDLRLKIQDLQAQLSRQQAAERAKSKKSEGESGRQSKGKKARPLRVVPERKKKK